MTTYERIYQKGDIVLVPFPFTDLSTHKKRPGLVISSKEINEIGDITIAFITSNLKSNPRPGDYLIKHWRKSGLPKPSMVRMKFVSLSKELIIKKIGHLLDDERDKICESIKKFLGD